MAEPRGRGRTPAWAVRTAYDVVPSVVLAGVAAHEQLYDHAGPLTWLAAQAVVWALVVRRRFPVPVFAATLAVAALGWAHHDLLFAHLAVLVALHAVSAHRGLRTTLLAALAAEAGAVAVAVRFGPTGSSNDALLGLTGLVLFAGLLGATQRTQTQYVEALRAQTRQLEVERQQQAQLAAADERARIAREMHDIIAHSVAVMIAVSEGAAAASERQPGRAADSMRLVAATGRDALAELRRVLSVLHEPGGDPADELAPQPALSELAALVDDVRAAGLATGLEVHGDVGRLAPTVQATVFRVVQEALTNTLKHAGGASRSTVRVDVGERRVTVRVTDDGRAGAAVPGPPAVAGGNGLRGMAERVGVHHGHLDAGPTEQGWEVTAVLELTAEPR